MVLQCRSRPWQTSSLPLLCQRLYTSNDGDGEGSLRGYGLFAVIRISSHSFASEEDVPTNSFMATMEWPIFGCSRTWTPQSIRRYEAKGEFVVDVKIQTVCKGNKIERLSLNVSLNKLTCQVFS